MTKMDPTSSQVQKFKILKPNEKLNGLNLAPTPRTVGDGTTPNSQDNFDNSARIFKSINDVQRFLEVKRSKATTVLDLFTTSLEAQRMRLKSYCERLMFKDPLAYGREAKDILWKKCYYDVISTAKQLRSDSQWQPDELSCIQIHLQSGIGHYHHILKRFQQEFNMSFTERQLSKSSHSAELNAWVSSSVYCCLVHLGDLSRYKLDLYPSLSHSMSLPACYYYQALYWRPGSGLPQNQLATLYNAHQVYIDATYHYFRCLNSPKPFEGAGVNLRILADKNRSRMRQNNDADSIPVYKLMVEHFVQLSYTMYYDLPLKPETKQLFVSYFESCLDDMLQGDAPPSPNTEWMHDNNGECSALQSYTEVDITHLLPWIQRAVCRAADQILDSRSLMKLMATLFLLCYKFKKHNSKKLSLCLGLTYQLMALLVKATVAKLEEMIARAELEPVTLSMKNGADRGENAEGEEEEDIKKVLGGCKRRLRRRGLGSNDSLNETLPRLDGLRLDLNQRKRSCEAIVGEDSEEEILFENNSEADEDNDEPWSPDERVGESVVLRCFIQLSETENLIQTIRLFVDWLRFDPALLSPSHSSSPHVLSFMTNYAALLNLVTRARNELRSARGQSVPATKAREWATTPLSEDWELRGMPPYHHIHAGYQWTAAAGAGQTLSSVTQTAIRLTRLVEFGSLVQSSSMSFLLYDETSHEYKLNETVTSRDNSGDVTGQHQDTAVRLSNGGQGCRMNGGGVVAPSVNDESGMMTHNGGTSFHHMTQMSNSSSPNHFTPDDELGGGVGLNGTDIGSDEETGRNNNNNNNNDGEDKYQYSQKNGVIGRDSGNLRLMGQAWLRSEVNKLDTQIQRNAAMCLSPYLVLDTECLASAAHPVKQLVYTNKFIIVIPNVVIQELDELKRSSGRVRDTIRWLEVQLRSGNRFLRTQRQTERKELSHVTYPKKKDKEAWNMYQILELCHHLASRTKASPTSSAAAASAVPLAGIECLSPSPDKMATLLTGHDKSSAQYEAVSELAASAAGIDVENISTFYQNWKSVCKSGVPG
uniref:Protein SMG5 n=1 Tax=Cacopsylla melanoneura TaxID=428564 RepID=A0A8D8LJB2_9HEMI